MTDEIKITLPLKQLPEIKENDAKQLLEIGGEKTKQLLVFDIDNTLICSMIKKLANSGNNIGFVIIEDVKFYIYKRPGLDTFLDKCFKSFDIAIWTASHHTYATPIIKYIFGDRIAKLKFIYTAQETIIKHNNTWISDSNYQNTITSIKPLYKVWKRGKFRGKYTKKNTLIIDDTPITYYRNYGNAIAISSWSGEKDDREFERIWPILELCVTLSDVRCRITNRCDLIVDDQKKE